MSIGGCSAVLAAVDTPTDQVENSEHIVTYEMTSDGTNASITYASVNGDGTLGVEQVAEAPTPFTKQLSVTGDRSAYSLVGQANDGTTISCKITVDSVVIVEQTSSGQFSVVLCAGSLPR